MFDTNGYGVRANPDMSIMGSPAAVTKGHLNDERQCSTAHSSYLRREQTGRRQNVKSPRQAHRGRCTGRPDPIECDLAHLWRPLCLRDSDRHAY